MSTHLNIQSIDTTHRSTRCQITVNYQSGKKTKSRTFELSLENGSGKRLALTKKNWKLLGTDVLDHIEDLIPKINKTTKNGFEKIEEFDFTIAKKKGSNKSKNCHQITDLTYRNKQETRHHHFKDESILKKSQKLFHATFKKSAIQTELDHPSFNKAGEKISPPKKKDRPSKTKKRKKNDKESLSSSEEIEQKLLIRSLPENSSEIETSPRKKAKMTASSDEKRIDALLEKTNEILSFLEEKKQLLKKEDRQETDHSDKATQEIENLLKEYTQLRDDLTSAKNEVSKLYKYKKKLKSKNEPTKPIKDKILQLREWLDKIEKNQGEIITLLTSAFKDDADKEDKTDQSQASEDNSLSD